MTDYRGKESLRYLESQGAKFVRIKTGLKAPMGVGWQNNPVSSEEVAAYLDADERNAVGLVTGKHSQGIIMLDADGGVHPVSGQTVKTFPEFEGFLKRLFPNIVGTAISWHELKPGRGKLLLRIFDATPKNLKAHFKENPKAPPYFELLSTGNQGLVAGKHPDGDEFVLTVGERGIVEIQMAELSRLVKLWTEGEKIAYADESEIPEDIGEDPNPGERARLEKLLEEAAIKNGLHKSGKFWRGSCPNHKGSRCELSAWVGPSGIHARCFVGNETVEELLDALGIGYVESKMKSDRVLNLGGPLAQGMHRALTEPGNGERLFDRHGENTRHSPIFKTWLVWNGKYWEPDSYDKITGLAVETVRSIYEEARAIPDADFRAKVGMHAARSETRNKVDAMIHFASRIPKMQVRPEELDIDPDLLCVKNGTLNLRTGRLEEHRKSDMITKMVDIFYDEGATCPNTMEWLKWATVYDEELVIYLLRVMGMCLFGGNPGKEAFFLYGKTNTGKTTLVRLLEMLAGPYAVRFNVELLLAQKMSRNANDATPELAKLHGARVAIGTEMPDGRRMNAAAFKDFTGRDTLTARTLHEKPFDFIPQFTPILYGNDYPKLPVEDEASFARLRTVPFKVQVKPEEINPNLVDDVFKPELPGILRAAFAAAVEVKEKYRGIAPVPKAVIEAGKEYVRNMDFVQQFIEDGMIEKDSESKIHTSEAYTAFKGYLQTEHGMKYPDITQKIFTERLKKALDCETYKSNGAVQLRGVKLTEEGQIYGSRVTF